MVGLAADHFINDYGYSSRGLPIVGTPGELRLWIVQAVALLIGIWLVLGTRGLARAIVRTMTFGKQSG